MPQTRSCDVTILVPTFNRVTYLSESLAALFSQTVQPRQIIVIDDGSTDGTGDYARSLGSSILYLRQENSGKSKALNHGLASAVGEMIWIFDDDDLPLSRSLELLERSLVSNPTAGFVFGRYGHFWDENGIRKIKEAAAPPSSSETLFADTMVRTYVHQPAMLVRKSCYDALGAFDESLPRSMDIDMLLRLAANYSSVYLPEVIFHQRKHDGMRGPAHAQVTAADVVANWRRFGQRIFANAYHRYGLPLYLQLPTSAELTSLQQISALLARAAAMSARGLWQFAYDDFAEASRMAAGLKPGECYSLDMSLLRHAMRAPGVLWDLPQRQALRRAIRSGGNRVFERRVRAALLEPLGGHVREAIRNARLRMLLRCTSAYYTFMDDDLSLAVPVCRRQ
ncbi:putative Glycosyl transferase [Novosphingobium sp. 9U]|nr:putative Glycosyl transferase [Novosphingobium sp. 9U]